MGEAGQPRATATPPKFANTPYSVLLTYGAGVLGDLRRALDARERDVRGAQEAVAGERIDGVTLADAFYLLAELSGG